MGFHIFMLKVAFFPRVMWAKESVQSSLRNLMERASRRRTRRLWLRVDHLFPYYPPLYCPLGLQVACGTSNRRDVRDFVECDIIESLHNLNEGL